METETFASRLASLIPPAKSERAFAREIGLSPAGLRGLLHNGNSPTLDTILAITRVRDVSIAWLTAGEGPRTISKGVETRTESTVASTKPLDPELMARVVDRIARIYRDEGVRLQDMELGRLAAERYSEIAKIVEGPDEWPALLDLVDARVRRSIRAAAADPANIKREA